MLDCCTSYGSMGVLKRRACKIESVLHNKNKFVLNCCHFVCTLYKRETKCVLHPLSGENRGKQKFDSSWQFLKHVCNNMIGLGIKYSVADSIKQMSCVFPVA